jgi:predicted dinucleotide-binding enzyme
MKLGIIGAGNVGSTLGRRWAAAGHEVRFGVRDVGDARVVRLLSEIGPKASAGSNAEAAASAEVVVLATPYDDTPEALAAAGDLAGKVLIDCTEPVVMGPDILKRGLLIGHNTSAAEQIAARAPGVKVVKTLNTVGWPVMANPQFGSQKAVMPYCGDDAAAKAAAARLVGDLGFEPLDAGPLANARLLEPFGMLWISLAFNSMGTDFAFSLVKR